MELSPKFPCLEGKNNVLIAEQYLVRFGGALDQIYLPPGRWWDIRAQSIVQGGMCYTIQPNEIISYVKLE